MNFERLIRAGRNELAPLPENELEDVRARWEDRHMSLDKDAVLAQIDEVFEFCGASPDHPRAPRGSNPSNVIGPLPVRGNEAAMLARAVAAIDRYATQAIYRERGSAYATLKPSGSNIDGALGTLAAIRADIAAGYGASIEQQAREGVFEDFLEMAEAINAEHHPAPAVVLAGAVLEGHLRKLCEAEGIPVARENGRAVSFEDMAGALRSKDKINASEKKLLTGWYGLRTDGAHGDFEKVHEGQVPPMIDGVRAFIVKHLA